MDRFRTLLSVLLLARYGESLRFKEHTKTTALNDVALTDCKGAADLVARLRERVKTLETELDQATADIKKQASMIHGKDLQLKACESQAAPAVISAKLPKITEPYFCPKAVSDNSKWRKKRTEMVNAKQHGYTSHGQWKGIEVPPTYFCDKLNNNLEPWVKPKLVAADLVVGIFTGESLFYSRAAATRDTWLMHFPHHYIFSAGSISASVHALFGVFVVLISFRFYNQFPSHAFL
jgi:hypothetical protein